MKNSKSSNIFHIPHHLFENEPHFWYNLPKFISQDLFECLCKEFPSIERFEWHDDNHKRKYGQRAHHRFYLDYEESLHHPKDHVGKGLIKHAELSDAWQLFMTELKTNREYKEFICSFLKVTDFNIRFEWHIATTGCEVSPHLDAPAKIGNHIFYFNTDEDWKEEWGGQTLILEEKRTTAMNPEVEDFRKISSTSTLNNYCFLQRNSADSWHAVKPLKSPADKHRRVLNIVFENLDAKAKGMLYRANYV